MARHIFISYSSEDRELAECWCAVLEREGLSCWIAPRDILPSTDWAEQIIDAIAEASTLVVLLTDASNRSQQVRREVERAVHKNVSVLPLRLSNVTLSKSLEYFLSGQQWFDAIGGTPETYRVAITQTLRTLSDAAPAKSVQPTGSVEWSRETLKAIEERLAMYVGPVAAVLVARASRQARNELDLIGLLAREIDDATARERFLLGTRNI